MLEIIPLSLAHRQSCELARSALPRAPVVQPLKRAGVRLRLRPAQT